MAIVRSGETEFDKETARWDLPKSQGGYRPDSFEAYPKMLYRAERRENGKVMCMDNAHLYTTDPAIQASAEAFTRKCQRVVMNESEHLMAKGQGWCDTPQDALELEEKHAQAIATAAAEENYRVRRMSESAQREHAEADAATDAPLADGVPVPKKAPRGTRVAVA